MHLISHIGSGICLGSIVYSLKRGNHEKSPFTIPLLIGAGAMLPDLDGVSIFFNHSVYYSSFWYSHHGALHSLFGIIPVSILVSLLITRVGRRVFENKFLHSHLSIFGLLYIGSVIHILEDLPCPPGPWQGLMVFWPLSTERYGGWGNIWWLDEYSMAVTTIGSICSMIILLVIANRQWARVAMLKALLVCSNSYVLFLTIRFVLFSKYVDPVQWEAHQRVLLGDFIYSVVKSWNVMIEHIWVRELI